MFTFKDYLAEVEAFGPTPVFKKFYGNYCGLGNQGGEPIDDIDKACMNHDMGYHHTKDPRNRHQHDLSLIKALELLLQSELTRKQRFAAKVILAWAKTKTKAFTIRNTK